MDITAEELRESVKDFRDPYTIEADREIIRLWWAHNNIPNQFAAMVVAAEIEKEKRD